MNSFKNIFNQSIFVKILGCGSDDSSPATDALAIMCVSVNGNFKILLGYFFTCGLRGAEKANLVRIAFEKIHDAKARGISLTFDGPSAHFAMAAELGASLDPDRLRPYFPHPSDPSMRVFIFLDIVHMLKLIRNCLGAEKEIRSSTGLVQWQFVESLHLLQKQEGLRAGTKLTRRHVEFEKNKMKCSLAAQTLSRSVADAIDFCREDLKLPQFQNSQATTEFIRYNIYVN